ncbi:hypothetical protein [Bacillus alkalicellulosilyticus]|uniref:hypothetical protein n=1 Tax=Alkalihalobacterium alkalicellulosilyticum TaxID=1912214 RepID=UPI000996FCE4|nr:hypothetical protein [Bacillus alkalicellulosilyticus]
MNKNNHKKIEMKKSEIFTWTAMAFSMGIALGFLLSPAKNGFGNNCGNTTNHYYQNDKPSTDDE